LTAAELEKETLDIAAKIESDKLAEAALAHDNEVALNAASLERAKVLEAVLYFNPNAKKDARTGRNEAAKEFSAIEIEERALRLREESAQEKADAAAIILGK
jgi:Holliday junction resolvasome RuvABC endonuclease subunit